MVFEHDEVLRAAQEYVSGRMRRADSVAVDRVDLSQGPDGILCALQSSPSGQGPERVLHADDLLMAMLMFCTRNRIPLPSRSDKSLELHGASLMVRMVMPSRRPR